MTFIECSAKCECLGCGITYPLTLKERGIHDISLELFIYHGVQINISVLKVELLIGFDPELSSSKNEECTFLFITAYYVPKERGMHNTLSLLSRRTACIETFKNVLEVAVLC